MRTGMPLLACLAVITLISACAGTSGPRPATAPEAPEAPEAPVAAPAPPSPPAPPAAPAETWNGAPPVLLSVPEDPTVSITLWFKVGSQNDPPGKEGLASLTASLLSEGATKDRGYQEILAALYPLAAGYSTRVDKEMTTLEGRTHRDNLDAYLDLFTAAFLRPRFAPEDFDRLRSNQLNNLEKTLRYAQDEELGKAALQSFVFAGTPYEHPPEGTVSGLKAITLEDIEAFYRQHYTRDNVVLALGGGTTPELVARLEKSLSALPAGKPAEVLPPAPAPITANEVLLISKPNADASISFGFPLDLTRGDEDFYALWLANSWLGEHRNSSSHLYKVIRETRGMNYGDYSYIEWFPEGGGRSFPPPNAARRRQMFEVWIRTLPNEQAHFALRAAVRELATLVEGGLSQEDFDLTQKFLSKYVLQYAATTQTRLGYALDDRFYGIGDPGHLERLRAGLASLTRDQVNAAIRRHLRADRLKIAIVTGEAESLKAALIADTPSPMTYAAPKPPEVMAEDEVIATWPLSITAEHVQTISVDAIFE